MESTNPNWAEVNAGQLPDGASDLCDAIVNFSRENRLESNATSAGMALVFAVLAAEAQMSSGYKIGEIVDQLAFNIKVVAGRVVENASDMEAS